MPIPVLRLASGRKSIAVDPLSLPTGWSSSYYRGSVGRETTRCKKILPRTSGTRRCTPRLSHSNRQSDWRTRVRRPASWPTAPARQNGLTPTERRDRDPSPRSEEHTSELQSLRHLVCRLLLEK